MLLARRGVFGFPARFRVLILCAALKLTTFLGDEFYGILDCVGSNRPGAVSPAIEALIHSAQHRNCVNDAA